MLQRSQRVSVRSKFGHSNMPQSVYEDATGFLSQGTVPGQNTCENEHTVFKCRSYLSPIDSSSTIKTQRIQSPLESRERISELGCTNCLCVSAQLISLHSYLELTILLLKDVAWQNGSIQQSAVGKTFASLLT